MSDAPGVPSDGVRYAGFWRRFSAYAIDYVLVAIGSVVLRLVATPVGVVGNGEFTLALLGAYFLYCTLLESSYWQATVGKRTLGLKVTNTRGEPIGFTRAAIRFVTKLLSLLTLFVGYLLIVVTKRHQALHDLLAGTLVTYDGTHRRAGWAVAAVCIAASVPVFGVLGAVVLTAYQDMTIRAQVTEGLALASGYRAAIETEWRNSPRDFADVTPDALGGGLPQRGSYVESIEVVSGMIVITYGAKANEAVAGSVLALVPALDSARTLAWACGYGQPPAGYEVVFENHAGYTAIDERYLPSACRSNEP